MLHRAALGSLERFSGILIESTIGNLPLWLAPVPVVIATITQESDAWAEDIYQQLTTVGISAEIDKRNEKIGYKIRQHIEARIPQIWVVGQREAENKQVAIRQLGSKKNQVEDFQTAFENLQNAVKMPQ
jgi:threonyl-tRNA synthetase